MADLWAAVAKNREKDLKTVAAEVGYNSPWTWPGSHEWCCRSGIGRKLPLGRNGPSPRISTAALLEPSIIPSGVPSTNCWHFGGSQTDVASLHAGDIDCKDSTISYVRLKVRHRGGKPPLIGFGAALRKILLTLPQHGPLFPDLIAVQEKDRANELRQRCHGLGVKGVTLWSSMSNGMTLSNLSASPGCRSAMTARPPGSRFGSIWGWPAFSGRRATG